MHTLLPRERTDVPRGLACVNPCRVPRALLLSSGLAARDRLSVEHGPSPLGIKVSRAEGDTILKISINIRLNPVYPGTS